MDVLAPRCHIAEGVKSIPLDFSTHSTLPPYNELQVGKWASLPSLYIQHLMFLRSKHWVVKVLQAINPAGSVPEGWLLRTATTCFGITFRRLLFRIRVWPTSVMKLVLSRAWVQRSARSQPCCTDASDGDG